jgi:hypothetical protein
MGDQEGKNSKEMGIKTGSSNNIFPTKTVSVGNLEKLLWREITKKMLS